MPDSKKEITTSREAALHQYPGKVVYVGQKNLPSSIEIIRYNKEQYTHSVINDFSAVPLVGTEELVTTWININGLNNTKGIKSLGEQFRLHPLVVEDIVDTQQRPKLEVFDDYIFLTLKMLQFNPRGHFRKEQISFILGKNYVLSFQESETDIFKNVKERINNALGRIRENGADYLMYALLDTIVDDYFIVSDKIVNKAEMVETRLFANEDNKNIVNEIQQLRREIMKMHKAILPSREVLKQLEKTPSSLIKNVSKAYLRDLSDHIVQVSENVDIYREIIWGLMEMHLTTINNKMNEVMKVLTIMASIFIPLTFISGIYGMNFKYIPELNLRYGYFYTLGLMLVLVAVMLIYFRRKKWL